MICLFSTLLQKPPRAWRAPASLLLARISGKFSEIRLQRVLITVFALNSLKSHCQDFIVLGTRLLFCHALNTVAGPCGLWERGCPVPNLRPYPMKKTPDRRVLGSPLIEQMLASSEQAVLTSLAGQSDGRDT